MKYLITTLLCLFSILLYAQENNPLINSGELITKGISLHDEGKYKESIDLYKKISRGDTNYYRAIYELAYSQMLDSQYAAAKQTCEIGLATPNERWPELYTLYGNIVDDMGDSERALRIYDTASRLYPAYADIYLNKGTTLIKLSRYAEAQAVFKQCILINPYQASAHYKLGICALEQGHVIQSFLSQIYYLLLQPSGRYQSNCIASLGKISRAGDDIKLAIQKRQDDPGDNFLTVEKIILSKIALDKQYKPLLKLDDVISRQIQVMFEKLEYDEKDPDFWMQYYVPFFGNIFSEKNFEPFINRIFSGVKIDLIQDYVKKNKKELDAIINEAVAYNEQIRATREINYATRKNMNAVYHHDNGKLYGKGPIKDKGETLTGDWEFYFGAGNLRSKGNYNDKGEKNGQWQHYHFNGLVKGKQLYNNGKIEGEELFYYDNGAPSTSATFKNGSEDGDSKSYYRTGAIHTATHYSMGKKNGERRTYYSTGSLQSIENYKEDSLDGPVKTYFKAGELESQGTYVNGKLDGPYKAYYNNGRLSMEGSYANGKAKGPWKQYHENGKLKITETFDEGLLEGEYAEYYDNEQLFHKVNYKKGNLSGDVEYFDRDGKRFFIYTYDNALVKAAKYYDKSGKQIGSSEKKSKKLDLTTYYTDGAKRSQETYDDNGNLTGPEKYFYRSGKQSSENIYDHGNLEGPGVHYYANGKPQSTLVYKEGEKHGYAKFWYTHGQLEEEGWYQDGLLQGTWLSYDELGNKSYTTEYLNDNLNGYKEEYYPDGRKSNEIKYYLGWLEEFVQFDTMGKEISHCTLKNGSGKFRVAFFNGKTYGEGNYDHGELDGPYRFYFFDGTINTLEYYKKGELDSLYRNYYYGGQIATEGRYRSGNKEGIWKTYLPNGKLNYTESYVDGQLEGKKIFYFEDGKVDTDIEFKEGERNGLTKKYDPDGSLMYQLRFESDLPVAYTYQDKSGKLVPEIPIRNGEGGVSTFFMNGSKSSEFHYTDGKLSGDNLSYYSNGKLRGRSTEDFGMSEGSYKYYYPSGQLKFDFGYLHDNLHGYYKEYNEKGVVTEEGYYYNGMPHRVTKLFDDSGKLKETRYFYYGKLLDIKK